MNVEGRFSVSHGGLNYEVKVQFQDDKNHLEAIKQKIHEALSNIPEKQSMNENQLTARLNHDLGNPAILILVNEAGTHTLSQAKPKGEWLKEDLIIRIREGTKVAESYWNKNLTSHIGMLGFLENNLVQDKKYLIPELKEALENNKKEQFINAFVKLPFQIIDIIDIREQINVLPNISFVDKPALTEKDVDDLTSYLADIDFSGVVTIGIDNDFKTIHTTSINSQEAPFSTQSLGKVFTGILLMQLIKQGKISEDDLDMPLLGQLEPHVVDILKEKDLDKKMEKITLRQVMTHTSGLGDYLGNHLNAVKEARLNQKLLPEVNSPEDQLHFADTDVVVLTEGQEKYSNLGSLLFGLTLQYHYNKEISNEADYLPYQQMLRKEIIVPAGLNSFSEKRPEGASYDPESENAEAYGGPAGGYWMNSEDLCLFGDWVCKQYDKDQNAPDSLHSLIEKHEREFYWPGEIRHLGAEETGTSYLSIIPEKHIIIGVVSNQYQLSNDYAAKQVYNAIMQQLFIQ